MVDESKLIAFVKDEKSGEFVTVREKIILSKDQIRPLKVPSIILEIGDNYVFGGEFSNLGKIPEEAGGILLGEQYQYSRKEFVPGSYYEVMPPFPEEEMKDLDKYHNS
ncbi:MAG: hypothetical protein AABW50_02120 [Nanoarchaeota archaeon]